MKLDLGRNHRESNRQEEELRVSRFNAAAIRASYLAVLLMIGVVSAQAQSQQPVACPSQQQDLIKIPEIKSENGRLRATIKNIDEVRTLWGSVGDNRCATQYLRVFEGLNPASPQPWPAGPEPLPGPTLRARVGDLVEITFLNQVNTKNFASTLDQAELGNTTGCDQYVAGQGNKNFNLPYPSSAGDKMPDCLHGSSTANIHFHGTHTTPSTTGDNVLLFVRPALREGNQLEPPDSLVNTQFAQFFKSCEQHGPPASWHQMPLEWQETQKKLLMKYDDTAPYKGESGALPRDMQLWPVNEREIAGGLWPQYQMGATPYCFSLPAYNPAKVKMGQAPGTHWYHAHKHGSTALNVANGMIGAFIIEGQYDDDLHEFYGPGLEEQVLMIQQLSAAPFPLTNPAAFQPGSVGRPQLSVNGRLDPVVKMRPGEVQLWRIINGAFRDATEFQYFSKEGSTTSCNPPPTQPIQQPCVQWRQTAQDGVQFAYANYETGGAPNNSFNLAPANRADLLVKAPSQPGKFSLWVQPNAGLLLQSTAGIPAEKPVTLLTVSVEGDPVNPPMNFIQNQADFPKLPAFLDDIPDTEITHERQVVFGPGNNTIDGKSFNDHHIDQAMLLNSAEEWTVENQANDKSHPFHIHINPFQIVALFEPNSPEATTPGNPCYVDPNHPDTWKPCPSRQPKAPFVWWDTFAIPTGQQIKLSASTCTTVSQCPPQLRRYITCTSGNNPTCTETIPGWFKMRSRFVDFTGQYVLHCHILIHEDRGMMQLIEVVPDTSEYTHH